MLRVKTYIEKSTIPDIGMGCFADENIEKGQLIWEFNPSIDRIILEEELKTFHPLEQEYIFIYSFMENGKYYLCNDNARFFNHSKENANTFDVIGASYASRDIKKGEEILSDYATFGTEDDKSFNLNFKIK